MKDNVEYPVRGNSLEDSSFETRLSPSGNSVQIRKFGITDVTTLTPWLNQYYQKQIQEYHQNRT